jgi:hypothetical protein
MKAHRLRSSIVLAVLTIGGLSACAESGKQVANVAADSRAYPVVEEGQAGSILQAVDATRVRGVNSTDSTGTDPRIVGPFRQLSLAEAKINAQQKKKAKAPAAIKRVALLVPADQGWPRFFLAVGDTRDESTYVLQVLTTPNARAPYGLWAQPVMLPGASLPEVAPPVTGAPMLTADSPGLVLTPKAVLSSYADYLNQSARSKDSKNFRRSTFSDQLSSTLAKDKKSLKAVADVTSKHTVVPGDPFALRTEDGGALVIGALTHDYTVTVKKGKGKVSITDNDLAALSGGKKDFKKSFTRTAMEVLVFRVPGSGSGPITLIAAERGDIGAKLN